jgi:hypothetical protein
MELGPFFADSISNSKLTTSSAVGCVDRLKSQPIAAPEYVSEKRTESTLTPNIVSQANYFVCSIIKSYLSLSLFSNIEWEWDSDKQ